MEKTKKVMLGVQMKKSKTSKRNRKRLLKQVVDYLRSDSYMYAPLIMSSSSSYAFLSTKARVIGLEVKEPIKVNNKRLVKKIVDYLKSYSYMCASMLASQQISSPGEGPVWFVKRVTKEISARTLTMDDNQPIVQSTNMIAEDQILEGNLPETSFSGPQTSAQREILKNMVYSNCRSSSIPGKGILDSRLRKLLVD